MRAATPSDGVLRESADGEYDWDLPNGRTLSFRGSWLVRIDYPGKAHLAFYYKRGRLARVTDEVGRVLALEYTEGRPGLEGYDTRTDVAAAGHLSRVILPDGRAIDYAYDNTHNLTRVSFADGTERRYHNADTSLAALNDPKQTGRPPPGRIENSEPVYGPGGEIVVVDHHVQAARVQGGWRDTAGCQCRRHGSVPLQKQCGVQDRLLPRHDLRCRWAPTSSGLDPRPSTSSVRTSRQRKGWGIPSSRQLPSTG